MADTNDLTKQLYVYCGVCLDSKGPFFLTSCAHILCQSHYGKACSSDPSKSNRPDYETRNSQSHHNLTCPVCKAKQVSAVMVTKDSLPSKLQPYFQPFLPNLEDIYAVAKFQYDGMVELVKYQSSLIAKLNQQIDKNKQLIQAAKSQTSSLNDYKS